MCYIPKLNESLDYSDKADRDKESLEAFHKAAEHNYYDVCEPPLISIHKDDLKAYFQGIDYWPVQDCLLVNWWGNEDGADSEKAFEYGQIKASLHWIVGDSRVNWQHWLSLPIWTPKQAVCLFYDTNPNQVNDSQLKTIPIELLQKAEFKGSMTPYEWKLYGIENSFYLPRAIREIDFINECDLETSEVNALVEPEQSQSSANQSSKPRKRIRPFERDSNEGLLLVKEMVDRYSVSYLDEMPATKAWGKIVSGEFVSDLIKTRPVHKNGKIVLNDGDELSKTDFADKYRRRFEPE